MVDVLIFLVGFGGGNGLTPDTRPVGVVGVSVGVDGADEWDPWAGGAFTPLTRVKGLVVGADA